MENMYIGISAEKGYINRMNKGIFVLVGNDISEEMQEDGNKFSHRVIRYLWFGKKCYKCKGDSIECVGCSGYEVFYRQKLINCNDIISDSEFSRDAFLKGLSDEDKELVYKVEKQILID